MKAKTAAQVRALLCKRINAASSQRDVAIELGISEGYLSDVVNCKKEPAAKLLKALGLRRVVKYVEA